MDRKEIAEEINKLEKKIGKDKLRKLYALRRKLKRKQEEAYKLVEEEVFK